jgi:hypothetical protein
MAIEISPSDEEQPEGHEPVSGDPPVALQPVPPQDSPTQFYEWALRREQLRLRRLIWIFAAFAALMLLLQALFGYLIWDTRNDEGPVRDVVVQQDPDAASRDSVQALEDDFAAFSDNIEERLAGAGASEETLGEVADDIEQLGRQIARVNRQSKAAIECLNGSIASLDEAVRDLLRQDISANEFVQRPATDCG